MCIRDRDSKQAVADAKRGGIRTVMITGDHKVTATAIAKPVSYTHLDVYKRQVREAPTYPAVSASGFPSPVRW